MDNLYKYLTLTLLTLVMFGALQSASAAQLHFIPQVGFSQYIGSSGDDWKPGYNLGLDVFNLNQAKNVKLPVTYGLHIAYNRWTVNSDEMLKTDGNEMLVEREKGVKDTWDITGLARYAFPQFQSRNFRHWLDIGLGVHYICTTDIEVKGFYRYGDSAVNREISRDAITDISPSITLGFTAMLKRQVQTSVRYQHFFESGTSSSGALLISLGMMAR